MWTAYICVFNTYGGTREVQVMLANLCNDVTCMRVSVMCTYPIDNAL